MFYWKQKDFQDLVKNIAIKFACHYLRNYRYHKLPAYREDNTLKSLVQLCIETKQAAS